ncbi:cGMP-dependent protein kinase, isozyme 1-like [Coccinella septempunctata]|uniref:cGMP-dependent protein kinase, isozyme 1-like n=1 Tax=Coccinella septempunctata TaxID=41139 RepID=UPI001D05E55D|nr:cGMP-dependent protein kinase, isozyme 1-like [Coccinella septempunctata]
MIKRLFSSSHSHTFAVDEGVYRRKSAIQILPANDGNKEFKSSVRKVSKSLEDEAKIRAAIEKNEFISHIITEKRLDAILRTIYSQEVKAGDLIIQEGEIGSELYISASGKFEIYNKTSTLITFEDTRVFGELALLYNEKRKASVHALTNGRLWVVENKTFKEIVHRSEEEERREMVFFLSKVPSLNTVPQDTLGFVTGLLIPTFFESGVKIVQEGDKGHSFFIIRAGSVQVTTKAAGVVATLSKGQYFGERALINEDVRCATVRAEPPGCECLVLSRKHFIKHFGDIKDFHRISITNSIKNLSIEDNHKYQDIEMRDLKRIRTIGAGGFGRVDLVQHKKDSNLVFALKYLKKYKCILKEQRDHVLNEKNVQMNCCCPFIIRMFKTFRDSRYLYFLMEAQLGGDLWRLLYYTRRKAFDDEEAKFYVACVIEAFSYLHERGIIYRDLKPENLLIANNGYVKLTDFGFAKLIGNGRTHSMVGTPDYMPPEIVLNKSHDRAVDCWTLGIFIYELITLKTPFKTCCDHDTYKLILKGLEHCKFPSHVSSKAKHLITRLCKARPSERFGYSKNGVADVKKHPWFSHFDWNELKSLGMKAPHVPKLVGQLDLSNFGTYKYDTREVPEVITNWDDDF